MLFKTVLTTASRYKLMSMKYNIEIIKDDSFGDLEEPRVLTINTAYGIQIQIEQDGQDAYIDLTPIEAEKLMNELKKYLHE